MKRIVLGALALALSVMAVGCGGGGGSGNSDPYYHAWFDVYGHRCNYGYPMPGCNFYSDGSKIIDVEDPNYNSGHFLENGTWTYTDSYGYAQSYYGYAWLSPDGILFDDLGYALNEDGQSDSSDLMAAAASQELKVVKGAGKDLAKKYALAEDTGVKIASTLNAWADLGKKQGRSDADIADFSARLYGVKLEKIAPAVAQVKQGDMSGMASLNNDVASYWNTDPETSKEILLSWYKSELDKFQSR